MSTLLYEVSTGSVISIHLKNGKTFKGECTLQLVDQCSRNPEEDKILLPFPEEVDLSSGRNRRHSSPLSFPISEIQKFEIEQIGLFTKSGNGSGYEDTPLLRPYQNGHGHHGVGSGCGGGWNGTSTNSNNSSSDGSRLRKEKAKKKGKTPAEAKDLEPIEIQLKTFVIRDAVQLKILSKLIKEVEVCGISFEGENVGRHGIVTWIVLTAGKTLIPFDIDSLEEQVPDLWKNLERCIFGNEKLVKVMHDGRRGADYLWHVRGIKIINVFDTQVADALIKKDYLDLGTNLTQLIPLSDCLQMYNRRIPLEELEFLRKYQGMDFSTNSPYLKKPLPPPEYLKLCAIKVKHLIPLRENLMVKLMERYSKCVEAHLNSFRNQDGAELNFKQQQHHEGEISTELLDALDDDMKQLVV